MTRTDSYYNSVYHESRFPDLIKDEEYFWARAELQSRFYFTGSESKARIFEYGCGIGQSIATLPNAVGWDISKQALEICRKRGINVVDRLEDAPKGEWDIVFCRHVLEHIENPNEALHQMATLLRPNGELYIVLPKEHHFKCRLSPDLDQHLYCWNFRAINNLLFLNGFAPYYNDYRYPLGWRAFLPLHKLLGKSAYYLSTQLGSCLRRNGEMIVRARFSTTE